MNNETNDIEIDDIDENQKTIVDYKIVNNNIVFNEVPSKDKHRTLCSFDIQNNEEIDTYCMSIIVSRIVESIFKQFDIQFVEEKCFNECNNFLFRRMTEDPSETLIFKQKHFINKDTQICPDLLFDLKNKKDSNNDYNVLKTIDEVKELLVDFISSLNKSIEYTKFVVNYKLERNSFCYYNTFTILY